MNNKLYCKYYLRNEWNLWEKVCNNLDKLVFVESYENADLPELNSYEFSLELDGVKYKVIYWINSMHTSIHSDYDCVLCPFDKYHNQIITNKIVDLISNDPRII